MQCILCKIYFWKVFHKYYNLICIFICTKNFILVKSGCYNYDLGINYQPGKANIVVDALSQRSHANHLVVKNIPSELCDEFAKLKLVANMKVIEMEVGSSLLQKIWMGQLENEKIPKIKRNTKEDKSPGFSKDY
jgi:hypothetical protein